MILHITLNGKPYPQPRVKVGKFGSYYSAKHKSKLKDTAAGTNSWMADYYRTHRNIYYNDITMPKAIT